MSEVEQTEKFIEHLGREQKAIADLAKAWSCQYIYTGKDKMARVDGFFYREGELKGIYEIKTRSNTLSWFKDYDSVLISFYKITIGAELSRLLRVPYFVIVETSDAQIITLQITDTNGKIICPMNIRVSTTIKSVAFKVKGVNQKNTTNAYLPLTNNTCLKILTKEER